MLPMTSQQSFYMYTIPQVNKVVGLVIKPQYGFVLHKAKIHIVRMVTEFDL